MTLHKLTLHEALNGLKTKKYSSVELTADCLERIKNTDKKLNGFITLCKEEALASARKADQLRSEGVTKPLLGIPLGIKDNFCTQGIKTTAASKVLDSFIAPYDATVTTRLYEAGAFVIGKNNMDAWAHGSSTETSYYGATRNPWDTTKLPGGSSGGSAASVAADQVIASIGSETAGSIRQPASWCGVVGLKPTYGRVSRYGVIAMGSSFDSPGPIAKQVKDAALLLEIIAGQDRYDATTSPQKVEHYSQVSKKDLKGITIGIPQEYIAITNTNVQKHIDVALKKLEKLGAKIQIITLLDPKYVIADYTILQRSEVSSNLGRYDGIRYGNGRDAFGEEAKRRIILGTYSLSAGYYDAFYKKAQRVRTLLIRDLNKAFQKVDVIAAAVSPSTALPVGSSKDHPMFGEASDILVEASSLAGLPGVSVPCGFDDGVPVGIQFFGPQFSEKLLLDVAYAYEQATVWHTMKPKL